VRRKAINTASAIWRFARALLFYPAAFGVMIWLLIADQHWIWGLLVLAAVLIFDPIYRVIFRQIVSWRPDKD
jgi:sterol desaturase/sphingolipid hydroxylase (fatty acid hydroxylase superfamily)